MAGAVALCIGALLALAVGGPVRRVWSAPWPIAWAMLALGIGTLALAVQGVAPRALLEPVVIVFYAAFAYFFCTGLMRCLRVQVTARCALPPAVAGAVALAVSSVTSGDTRVYLPPALLLMFAAIGGLINLRRVRASMREAGNLAVTIALVFLALSGLRYAIVVLTLGARGLEPSLAFWVVNSVGDVIFVVTAAVGAMLMTMDRVHAKLRATNADLAAAKDSLEMIAKVDPLTGASNRYAFQLCLRELGSLDGYTGCLIMIDIDNLKTINDVYGHVAGDRAICGVADRLRSLVRPEDRIFRWGGDEFVVLLFDASPQSATERISKFGTVPISANGADPALSASISWGVAAFGRGRTIEDVLKSADANLYSARRELP